MRTLLGARAAGTRAADDIGAGPRDDGSAAHDTLVRLTPQRRAVLDALRATTDHPTAAEVYERVRATSPGIGAATVYRSLSLLVDAGLALELQLGEGAGARRYDANTGRHDHLVCDRCGAATDIDAPLLDEALRRVSVASGYAITTYDLQFRGLCPACRA